MPTAVHGSVTPVAAPSGPLTDDGLYQLLTIGVLSGTPVLFIVAVVISYVSGVGVGNALAIAVIPALFGGVTFGGFVAMMRHLRREDRAHDAARSARQAAAPLVPQAVAAAA